LKNSIRGPKVGLPKRSAMVVVIRRLYGINYKYRNTNIYLTCILIDSFERGIVCLGV